MSWPKRLFLGAVFALTVAACSGRTELDGEGGNPPALFVRQVLALGPGAVVQLDRMVGEPVDVYVGDRRLATGEVVVVGEHFGVRIGAVLPGGRSELS